VPLVTLPQEVVVEHFTCGIDVPPNHASPSSPMLVNLAARFDCRARQAGFERVGTISVEAAGLLWVDGTPLVRYEVTASVRARTPARALRAASDLSG
jgi:hypothetical protein